MFPIKQIRGRCCVLVFPTDTERPSIAGRSLLRFAACSTVMMLMLVMCFCEALLLPAAFSSVDQKSKLLFPH